MWQAPSTGFSLEVPLDMGSTSATSVGAVELTRTSIDTADYDGALSWSLEFIASSGDAANKDVQLVNSSGALMATITVAASSAATLYRTTFTPTSGANNYRLSFPATGTSVQIYLARILVRQIGATKTRIQIPLTLAADQLTGNSYGQGNSRYHAIWRKDLSSLEDLGSGSPWTFECYLYSSSGTRTAYASLYSTGGTAVTASEVTTTSTTPVLLSASFADTATGFSDQTEYTVRIKSSNGAATSYIQRSWLWVRLTNLSRAEVRYRIAPDTTLTGTPGITDLGRVRFDSSAFSNSLIYHEATGADSDLTKPVTLDWGNAGSTSSGTSTSAVSGSSLQFNSTTRKRVRSTFPFSLSGINQYLTRWTYASGTPATASYVSDDWLTVRTYKDSTSSGWSWVHAPVTVNSPGAFSTQSVTSSADYPGSRNNHDSWAKSDGSFWIFGGFGYGTSTSGYLNDLWKFDGTNWTWIKGSSTPNASASYGTQGVTASSNVPGGRFGAFKWQDSSGNFWIYGGEGYDSGTTVGFLADMWKFDGTHWTWVMGSNVIGVTPSFGTLNTPSSVNHPGGRRSGCFATIGDRLYVFGGNVQGAVIENDLWSFNPTDSTWTWLSGSSNLSTGATPSYGTQGVASSGNMPPGRQDCTAWADSSGNLWIFGGYGSASQYNDVWKWDGTNWTWMSGSSSVNQNGIYGTRGVSSGTYMPGARDTALSWVGSNGLVYIFGGKGFPASGTTTGSLNDLWAYNMATNQWTWISGSKTINARSAYIQAGQITPLTGPGARTPSGSVDTSGSLWLFGGNGYDSTGSSSGFQSDLWKFTP